MHTVVQLIDNHSNFIALKSKAAQGKVHLPKWTLQISFDFSKVRFDQWYYRGTNLLCQGSFFFLPSKGFYINLFTTTTTLPWPVNVPKLAEAEIKQHSSHKEHQSKLSHHNPTLSAQGWMRPNSEAIPPHKGQLQTMATSVQAQVWLWFNTFK